MTSEFRLTVRTYECDSYGHVNNAVYLNYLETARWFFLKDIGFNYDAAHKRGYGTFVARIEIDYKHPALADDELLIKTKPIKRGAVSGTVAQEILCGDSLIAKAVVTWAFVDSTGRPVKIPPEFNVPGLNPD